MGLFHTAWICAQPLHALIFPYNTFGKNGTKFKQYVRQHEWSPHNIYRIIIFPSKWFKNKDLFPFQTETGDNCLPFTAGTAKLCISSPPIWRFRRRRQGRYRFLWTRWTLLMAGSQHGDKRSVRVLHSHERGVISTKSALPCTICCCILPCKDTH